MTEWILLVKSVSPMMRRDAIVTLGVQAVVLDRTNQVLLVRHGYRPGWHFPGGGVERRETLASAIRRELEEEAGVVLDEPARTFGIYSHFDAFPGDHIVLVIAGRWRQPRVPGPNREIAELGFFPREALPAETTAPTRARLREIFEGRPKAEIW